MFNSLLFSNAMWLEQVFTILVCECVCGIENSQLTASFFAFISAAIAFEKLQNYFARFDARLVQVIWCDFVIPKPDWMKSTNYITFILNARRMKTQTQSSKSDDTLTPSKWSLTMKSSFEYGLWVFSAAKIDGISPNNVHNIHSPWIYCS